MTSPGQVMEYGLIGGGETPFKANAKSKIGDWPSSFLALNGLFLITLISFIFNGTYGLRVH